MFQARLSAFAKQAALRQLPQAAKKKKTPREDRIAKRTPSSATAAAVVVTSHGYLLRSRSTQDGVLPVSSSLMVEEEVNRLKSLSSSHGTYWLNWDFSVRTSNQSINQSTRWVFMLRHKPGADRLVSLYSRQRYRIGDWHIGLWRFDGQRVREQLGGVFGGVVPVRPAAKAAGDWTPVPLVVAATQRPYLLLLLQSHPSSHHCWSVYLQSVETLFILVLLDHLFPDRSLHDDYNSALHYQDASASWEPLFFLLVNLSTEWDFFCSIGGQSLAL